MGKSGNLNCASYMAGIIEGILVSSKMHARVTAHTYGEDDGGQGGNPDEASSTIFVIKFAREVTMREKNSAN